MFALHHGRTRGNSKLTYDLEALIALTLRSNACIGVEAAASVDVLCSSLLEEANRRDSVIVLRRYVERNKLAIFWGCGLYHIQGCGMEKEEVVVVEENRRSRDG